MELLYAIGDISLRITSQGIHLQLADLLYVYMASTLEFTGRGHENDFYTIQWLFAIIFMYIKNDADDKVTRCFLMGLQSIFIQDTHIGHQMSPAYVGQFKCRELINTLMD